MASSRLADHIGRVLGGRYRLLAPVGTGASAHVFVADDTRLGRRVAVKVLHPALATDASFLRRFGAEARAAAALNHPNVLAVYDWGDEGDGPYLVTEYLAGGSLRAILDRGHRLTPAQALVVGLEAARGLDYAHRRGLVHRDIKPANLIFDDDGRLRIADFGLARALAEAAWTEPSGVALGTARYAAPEQARGLAVDGKADVYSLALVLVETVTGRVPFAADTTVATLMGRLERPIPVPDSLGPLAGALRRAGTADPGHRADAMAFGTALQAVAPLLEAPEPLPLAGLAALDDPLAVLDADPTELGSVTRSPAAASGMSSGMSSGPASGPASGMSSGPASTFALPPVRVPGGRPPALPSRTPITPTGPTLAFPSPVRPSASAAPAAPARERRRRSRRRSAALDSGPEVAVPAFVSNAGRRRRRKLPILVGIVLALSLVAGGAYAYMQVSVPTHALPDIAGQPRADAEAALRELGFEPASVVEYSDDVAEGLVIAQDPPVGERLREGRAVRLVVSDGRAPTDIPDLAGLSDGAAAAAIAEAGLVVDLENTTHVFDETVPKAFVIDWLPRTGTPRKGTPVALRISSGPEPRVIPSLAGATFDQARAELAAKRLEVTRADAFSDSVPEGRVISTEPAQGTSVARGSTVKVNVSKGQPSVPNLNGKTRAQAEATLVESGLRLGAVYGPGGTVFRSSPMPGTRVQTGSVVDVYIG